MYNSAWLVALDKTSIEKNPIPIYEILKDSLYYPCSYMDPTPLKLMTKYTSSFIYVDYGLEKEVLLEEYAKVGLKGYELLGMREMKCGDIIPPKYKSYFQTPAEEREMLDYCRSMSLPKDDYVIWTVWQRNSEFGNEYGPRRLSMLAICHEAITAYEALYYLIETVPLVMVLINPGHAFGLNWTNLYQPGWLMHRIVVNNHNGLPRYLLQESDDAMPYWPEYRNFIGSYNIANLESGSHYNEIPIQPDWKRCHLFKTNTR
ncbi:hypothetical protein FJZ33_03435 [Candidatus Poribacteria bacterium]|nr:hypothetical protein [Candidatus Poribacteria bacterium]